MERHPLHDNPIGGQPVNAPQSLTPQNVASPQGPIIQGPPQLPPQMFTTAAQLLDLTDSKYSRCRMGWEELANHAAIELGKTSL